MVLLCPVSDEDVSLYHGPTPRSVPCTEYTGCPPRLPSTTLFIGRLTLPVDIERRPATGEVSLLPSYCDCCDFDCSFLLKPPLCLMKGIVIYIVNIVCLTERRDSIISTHINFWLIRLRKYQVNPAVNNLSKSFEKPQENQQRNVLMLMIKVPFSSVK